MSRREEFSFEGNSHLEAHLYLAKALAFKVCPGLFQVGGFETGRRANTGELIYDGRSLKGGPPSHLISQPAL